MNNQDKSMLWAYFSSFFWRLCPYMTLRDIICRKTNPSSIWCWLCVFLQPNTPGSPLITVVLLTTALWVNDPGMNWENHKINKHLVTTTTTNPGDVFFSFFLADEIQKSRPISICLRFPSAKRLLFSCLVFAQSSTPADSAFELTTNSASPSGCITDDLGCTVACGHQTETSTDLVKHLKTQLLAATSLRRN